MSCGCTNSIGDCGAGSQITIAANLSISGFRQFEPWPIAGTVDCSQYDPGSGMIPVAGGWSKTNFAAGEFLKVRHYRFESGSGEISTPPVWPFAPNWMPFTTLNWTDRGIRIFRARAALSPAPAPPVHLAGGDGSWQEMDLNRTPFGEPNRSWSQPLYNAAEGYPAGQIVTKVGSSAGPWIATSDVPVGTAPPALPWAPWQQFFNLDQTAPKLFKKWTETASWSLPDGVTDFTGAFGTVPVSPATGSASRSVNRITYAGTHGPDDTSGMGTLPDCNRHFWRWLMPPQWGGGWPGFVTALFGTTVVIVLDDYSRTDSKIVATWKEVNRQGADVSPANRFTQTVEMADEFLADDEWMIWAQIALAAASFAGLINLKHYEARLNLDGTTSLFVTLLPAGGSSIRGVRALQKLLQSVVGDYCLNFHPSPSGAIVCTQGHASSLEDLVVEPPTSNGFTTVSNPCTCAP